MTRPAVEDYQTDYDIFLCWRMEVDSTDYLFKYALNRTVDHPGSGTYQAFGGISDRNMELRGTWLGALTSISPIRKTIGDDIAAKVIWSSTVVVISNIDQDDFDNLVLCIKESNMLTDPQIYPAILMSARGETIDPDTDVLFRGYVEPGGVKIYPDRVEMTIVDIFKKYDVDMFGETLSIADFPDMDPNFDDWMPAVIFGEFSEIRSDLFGLCFVECALIQATANDTAYMRAFTPGPGGTTTYSNSRFIRIAPTGAIDGPHTPTMLAVDPGPTEWTGIFQVQITHEWKEGDRYYLYLENMGGDRDVDFNDVLNPAALWHHVLTVYAGVPTGLIDDNYLDIIDYWTANYPGQNNSRRIYKEPTKMSDFLEELHQSFGLATIQKNGKISLVLSKIWPRTATETFYTAEIEKGSLHVGISDVWESADRLRLFTGCNFGFYPDEAEMSLIYDNIIAIAPADPYPRPFKMPFEFGGNEFFTGGPVASEDLGHNIKRMSGIMVWDPADQIILEVLYRYALSISEQITITGFNNIGIEAGIVKRLLGDALGIGDVVAIKLPEAMGGETLNCFIYEESTDLEKGITKIKAYQVTEEAE